MKTLLLPEQDNRLEMNKPGFFSNASQFFTLDTLPFLACSKRLRVLLTLVLFGFFAYGQPFVTTWNTSNLGSSANNQILIPGTGTNYNIAWEEVGNPANNGSATGNGSTTVTFPSAGTYKVSITPGAGTFTRIEFGNGGDRRKLLAIEQWGDIAWSSMEGAFFGCNNLTYNATDAPNLAGVTSLVSTFRDCTVFNGAIGNWNTANVTTMDNMFLGAADFNQPIGNWNTANVTTMYAMFRYAADFNQNIGNWNTANVTTMTTMFLGATAFNQPIGDWNTTNVLDMFLMFQTAASFNQPLGNWTLNSAVDLSNMLDGAGMDCANYSATLIGWNANPNTPNNRTLGASGRLYGTNASAARTNLTTTKGWTINGDAASGTFCEHPFVTTWNTSNSGTSNSDQIRIPGTGTNYNIAWEEVGNPANNGSATGNGSTTVTFPSPGIYKVSITPGAGTFTRIAFINSGDRQKLLTIEQWGAIAWSSMENAFYGCNNLTYNATDAPNLAGVTSLVNMFNGCTVFNGAIGNWNTASVTVMTNMFLGAAAFNQPIGNWNTASVTNMYAMFEAASDFNQNIGNWNTANVTNMTAMFFQAADFNQNIGNWNTASVTTMRAMFQNAVSFNQPIGDWNTANVTDMSSMFYQAASFNQPIGNWNTANVTDMFAMFFEAAAFNQPLGNWTLNSAVNLTNMLGNSGMDCTNYSATLIGWNANPNTPNNRTLGASGRLYGTNAVAARTNLTTTKGWTISSDAASGTNCSCPATGTVWYVNLTGLSGGNGASWDCAFQNLQDAIEAASSGHQIWVQQATYLPTKDPSGNATPADPRTKTFVMKEGVKIYGGFAGTETLLSERNWTANVTILSGDLGTAGNNGDNAYHVIFNFENGLTAAAELNGFTVTGGNANGAFPYECGGGMQNKSSSPTVANCTFSGNTDSVVGGGMCNDASSPALANCIFSGNAATNGGGMFNYNSANPTLTGCTFTGNASATNGGGMYNDGCSPALGNCTFSGNSAVGGGGIYNYNSANPTLTGCTFSGNAATNGGGMWSQTNSAPSLTNCTLSGNSASNIGGAMFNDLSSPVLVNCSLSGNAANLGGGMWSQNNAAPSLTNCTVSGNRATNDAGGFYNLVSILTLKNSLVWNNQANGVTGSESASLVNFSGTLAITFSLLQNHNPAGTGNLNGIPNAAQSNYPTFVTPLDPATAPATGGDFHLMVCSPALNVGDNTGAPATDLFGNPRPFATTVDLGVHEVQSAYEPPPTVTCPADFTVTQSDPAFSLTGGNPAGGTYSGTGVSGGMFTPASAGVSTHTIIYTYQNASGCTGTCSFVITVVCVAAPSVSPTNTTICEGSSAILTATVPPGVDVTWHDAATGGNQVGTGTTLTVSPGSMTSYFAQATLPGAASGSQSFLYEFYNPKIFTVPAGVTSLHVVAKGAGADGGAMAGTGGSVEADLTVTPGQVLNINVGANGFLGGANGGTFGGGGATDIRIGGNNLEDRVLVAGGGGSYGFYQENGNNFEVAGGDGGGLTGGNGENVPNITGGGGGSQNAGGAGGSPNGGDGSFGQGGIPNPENEQYGGGGGGWYGGGSGGNYEVQNFHFGGGGGGSSYAYPTLCSNVVHVQGGNESGSLVITWQAGTSCASTRTEAVVNVNVCAGTRYVKPDGSDANTGLSWAQAFQTLQKALEVTPSGDEIWVAAGTYLPTKDPNNNTSPADPRTKTFMMRQGVEIYGGFLGTETLLSERDWTANVTTLSGDLGTANDNSDNAYHVIFNDNNGLTAAAELNGFTVTGGNANAADPQDRGAGMANFGVFPTVSNCTFSGNAATIGGGMSNEASSPALGNCAFSGNSATDLGGAMLNNLSSPVLVNCLLSGNAATSGGGIFNQNNAAPSLTNCTLTGNSASDAGGAIFNDLSSPVLVNCLLSGNAAISGGGMYSQNNAAPSLTNCTVSGNRATGDGGGFYNLGSTLTLKNCLVWNNRANGVTGSESASLVNFGGTLAITFSLLQNHNPAGTGNLDGTINAAVTNLPDFVTPLDPATAPGTAGDFHVQACSPAVNAGTGTGAPATDLFGNARPFGSAVDLGVHELQSAPTTTVATCQNTTLDLDGNGMATLDPASLNNGSTGCLPLTFLASTTAFTCANLGANSVTLTVNGANNATATCPATVTVRDLFGPAASCQDVSVSLSGGVASVTPAQINFGSTDNCGTVNLVSVVPNSFTCSDLGANFVTLNIKDGSNNSASCQAIVTVTGSGMATWYDDDDNDGFGDPGESQMACVQPAGFVLNNEDCDDTNAAIKPGATELPGDNVDQNCDGAETCFTDADDDGARLASTVNSTDADCLDANEGVTADPLDCDDTNAAINPSATETCNSIDDDCDTQVDENLTFQNWYFDGDGDDFGAGWAVNACQSLGPNFVLLNGDCNDGNAAIKPGATELPGDNVDQNCDGAETCFTDADNDGARLTSTVNSTDADCLDANEGVTADPLDCDDANVAINPSATETCNSIDDDCDTQVDEGFTFQNWYLDGDNDSFGAGSATNACQFPGSNFVTNNGDCNDVNAAIHPGATETCNNLDDDCDNLTDNADPNLVDNTPPSATCKNHSVALGANGTASVTPANVFLSGSDNCGTVNLQSVTPNSFTCSNLGSNQVTLTVNDGHGNNATCTATVTVGDNLPPTAICKPATLHLNANGQATLTTAMVNDGSSDNCTVSLSLSQTSFNCGDIGTNSVMLTATDPGNNSASCTATVTVVDDLPPAALCQNLSLSLDANGQASLTAAQIDAGSSDNCGISSLNISANSFTCNDLGANPVTLTVEDMHDNTSSCTATVTVVDDLPPTVACQNITIQLDADGEASITPAQVFDAANSGDNCGTVIPGSVVPNQFDCTDVGDNPVTLTAHDGHGNICGCTATVTVADFFTNLSITATPEECSMGNGSLLVTAEAPGGQVGFSINGGASWQFSGLFENLTAGNYSVMIQAFGVPGCTTPSLSAEVASVGAPETWFKDLDEDGYSDGISQAACDPPGSGWFLENQLIATSDDCNDYDADEHPGAVWYRDMDNDDWSNGSTLTQCDRPWGYKTATEVTGTTGDCDDTRNYCYPGAPELCNNLDDDCDGQVDEGLAELTHVGNVTFTNQAQVNAWSLCYTVIQGNLTIQNASIDSLTNLVNLRKVTGNVTIKLTGLDSLSWLLNLDTIGGTLNVNTNSQLDMLHGLDSLVRVGGGLKVFNNQQLTQCCAIYELIASPDGVGGTISIYSNDTGCDSQAEIEDDCEDNYGGGGNNLEIGNWGIGNYAMAEEVRIALAPNPADAEVTVRWQAVFAERTLASGSLRVFDARGSLAFSQKLETLVGEAKLDVSGWQSGIYLVQVVLDSKRFSQKLMVE